MLSDFNKVKIGFALALLGSLFSINPIISSYGNIGFTLFNIVFSLRLFYYAFAILLSISVYFFAISLIGENTILRRFNRIGNITYAIALTVPLFSLLLYFGTIIGNLINMLVQNTYLHLGSELLISIISGVISSITFSFIQKSFKKADKNQVIELYSKNEFNSLIKAKELLKEGFFDISLLEVWKVAVLSLKKSMIDLNIKPKQNENALVQYALSNNIISENIAKELELLLNARNLLVHEQETVNKKKVEESLKTVEKLISHLETAKEKCYFCGAKLPKNQLEYCDTTGAYVCQSCAESNPNWRDELISMGMDP